jgi:beta-N-acetylglucosaminidase
MAVRGKWGAVKDRDPKRAEEIYANSHLYDYSAEWHLSDSEYISAVENYLENQPETNLLKHSGAYFVQEGKEHGVDPIFALAVAIHETGYGKSNYLKKYNNAFGIQPKGEDGEPAGYPTLQASINSFCKLIAGPYFKQGQRTVIDITDKKGEPEGHNYCGEHHDSVSRLDWITGISKIIEDIIKSK